MGQGDRREDWYYIGSAQGGTGGWGLYSGETEGADLGNMCARMGTRGWTGDQEGRL